MPRPPKQVDPNTTSWLHLELPGWLKNDIITTAQSQGMHVSEWATIVLYAAIREGKGLPLSPEPRPVPSLVDEIRAWAVGERLLMPCGVVRGGCGFVLEDVGVGGFCGSCGVRVG